MARQQATATSWALGWKPNCQRPKYDQSTGRDSNPRRRITGAVSSPLDDQCSYSVGPVGIEPTSSGLRDRCITLSATVPNQSARRELNPRPASYKDAALTAELRAQRVGPEGIEPTPYGLKVRRAACYTTTPKGDRAYAFQPTSLQHHLLLRSLSKW